jgi:hypothetical protein
MYLVCILCIIVSIIVIHVQPGGLSRGDEELYVYHINRRR